MHVTVVQYDMRWQDPSSNYPRIDRLLDDITHTDLILLPEMWATGFTMEAPSCAEAENGSSVAKMIEWSQKYDCPVAGTLIIEDKGSYYNRFLLVNERGIIGRYDKHFLFGLAREQEHYSPGTQKVLWEVNGWRLCPMVCYDLRFPEWSRNREGFDLLLYPASWPRMRHHAWQSLLVARAIENQCYVVGCNRTGTDGNGFPFKGGSAVIDYAGKASRLDSEEALLQAVLNKEAMMDFRSRYPFLRDMD